LHSSKIKFLDMSAAELDNEFLASAELLYRQRGTAGVWRLRGSVHSAASERAECGDMKTERSPTTYLTIEELTQIAAEKFEAAALLAPSFEKEELLRSAENLRHLAEIKGWPSSELRPPK
jgi:hypothetical protein